MDKRFIGLLIAVVLVLGGLFYFSNKSKPSNTNSSKSSSTAGAVSNHTAGTGNKGVTLIEYGDFQCPACGAFFPVVKQVKEKYGDDIKFQFRNFPLDSIHQNARAGARAAEAASLQNKFWEMHDLLYQQQQTWGQSTNPYKYFEGLAQQLGLNTAQFKTDYSSTKVNETINADIAAGQKIKATSTPTFQLNGQVIDSETQQTMGTLAGFSKVIDAAIAKKASASKTSTPATTRPTPTPAPTPAEAPAPAAAPASPSTE